VNKVLVIAAREYKAAVRTKAFLLSLLLMPVLIGVSAGVQYVLKTQANVQDKTFAVIDRTPGEKVFPLLETAAERRNRVDVFDPKMHEQTRAKFQLVKVEPSAYTREAVDRQRLELSEAIEKGKAYWGFLDIGPDAVARFGGPAPSGEGEGDPLSPRERRSLRYQTNHPTYLDFQQWAQQQIIFALTSLKAGVPFDEVAKQMENQSSITLKVGGLSKLENGKVVDPPVVQQVARFLIPGALVALMFMVIMLSSTPAMHGVVEEKMQRIAEVLLGSVSPFRLMAGKLLGLMAVSLTIAAVYLGGGYWVAQSYGVTENLSPRVLAWFLVFQASAVVMYGSLFLAIGAAATDIKETQTLVMPVMLIACIPMLILGTAIEDPNSPLVVGMSFFPPVTPMLIMVRLATPPYPPWWHAPLAVALVLAVTTACVYAAGRIFRVGILMQGKGARFAQLLQWVVRG
jgi:ABC-2 type transport system permease protein